MSLICGDSGGVNSAGNPCGRRAQPGFERCNLHGASGTAAKIKAELALAQARIPSCEALFYIVNQFLENTCATCGYPTGETDVQRTVIRAAQVILDRTGMGPHSTVELTKQSDGELDLRLLTGEERGQLAALIAQVNAIKEALRMRSLGTGAMAAATRTAAASASDTSAGIHALGSSDDEPERVM